MSSQLFCCGFFGAIYQDSYSTGCICTAASGGYAPLRSFFRSISDDLFFQARLGCAGGGIALRGGCPGAEFFVVRIFLYSEWMRGFAPWVSVSGPRAGWGGGGVRVGGLVFGPFSQCHWGGIFALNNYFCTILFTVHVQALTQRALFLYSLKTSKYYLKTSKSLWLSDVFKKYKKEMRNEKWINV